MRELDGLSYAELADALDTSVPAIKSLLVRARIGLVEAGEARDAACVDIRADLVRAHGRGVRASGRSRRHLRDCDGCREYRQALRGVDARPRPPSFPAAPARSPPSPSCWASAAPSSGAAAAPAPAPAGRPRSPAAPRRPPPPRRRSSPSSAAPPSSAGAPPRCASRCRRRRPPTTRPVTSRERTARRHRRGRAGQGAGRAARSTRSTTPRLARRAGHAQRPRASRPPRDRRTADPATGSVAAPRRRPPAR